MDRRDSLRVDGWPHLLALHDRTLGNMRRAFQQVSRARALREHSWWACGWSPLNGAPEIAWLIPRATIWWLPIATKIAAPVPAKVIA